MYIRDFQRLKALCILLFQDNALIGGSYYCTFEKLRRPSLVLTPEGLKRSTPVERYQKARRLLHFRHTNRQTPCHASLLQAKSLSLRLKVTTVQALQEPQRFVPTPDSPLQDLRPWNPLQFLVSAPRQLRRWQLLQALSICPCPSPSHQ